MDTFCERFAQKLPADYKRELLNVIGDNDMVVVYVRQTWTGRDGQHHQALGFDMFRVKDGMIAEHWVPIEAPYAIDDSCTHLRSQTAAPG